MTTSFCSTSLGLVLDGSIDLFKPPHSFLFQWLIDAAVRLNPKLRLSPRCQQSALHAITRLDLSNNDLSEVPAAIFQMQSLKILVLSQNKLDSLPVPTPKKVFGRKKADDGAGK